MSNLVLFQKQLQNNNAEGVRQFLAALPQMSANGGLRQAGEAFGFPTAEIGGIRYMLGRDLARVGYGHKDSSNLGKLLKRYSKELLALGGFGDDSQILIREAFSLDLSDFRSTLATWGDLLIVGMKGETEAARKIMAYLLEAEEKARVSQACEGITGMSPRQLEAAGSDDPILQALAQAQQLRLRQIETEKTLALQAQALTNHDQALADQGKKIKAIAASQESQLLLTPEQESMLYHLMDRLISARAAARKQPAGMVAPVLWNWVKRGLGIRTFRTISQAQYPMALDKIQTQLAREETAAGQASLKLVKPKTIKPKAPWSDL